MSKIFGSIILILLSFSVFSQQKVISGSIQWVGQDIDQSLVDNPFFLNAVESRPDLQVPVFIHSLTFDDRMEDVQGSLVGVTTRPFDKNKLSQTQYEQVTADFQIQTSINRTGGKVYLDFEIIPFRKGVSGMEALTSYEIQLSQNFKITSKSRALDFAEHSVLANGEWYKIAIAQNGVYKIDFSKLNELGIDVQNLNPNSLNIYGNGGGLLPFDNDVYRHDDLKLNPIYIEGENDGSFDSNDYILFYAEGPDTWSLETDGDLTRFVHDKHYYSDSAYYYLRVDDVVSSRINTMSYLEETTNQTITTFDDYQFVENENANLVKSGREFFGENFDITTAYSFNFPMPFLTADTAVVEVRVAGRSVGGSNDWTLSSGGFSSQFTTSAVTTSATSSVAKIAFDYLEFVPSGSNISATVSLDKFNAASEGWLDFIRVNARRELKMAGNQMAFRSIATNGVNGMARYELQNAGSVTRIWDVTNAVSPNLIEFSSENGNVIFNAPSDELRQFVASGAAGFLEPRAVGKIWNQDLHGLSQMDMIILSSPRLLSQSEQLAQIHSAEGLAVQIVTPMQVYNEFSSGNPDVTAVKMLMKMFYDRAGENEDLKPKYLLIFGDGSFRNRGLSLSNGFNVITYQNWNETSPTGSYVSDDYFAFLSDEASETLTDKLEIGVGRIPASSVEMAQGYVDKVKIYISGNTSSTGEAYCLGEESQSPFGAWRNSIVFVADDQDGNGGPTESVHMTYSDELADEVRDNYNDYNIQKIYLDAYQQISTPGGERYPEAVESIKRTVQNGALLVNYIGHGGEKGWAHERVLDISTIQNWTNKNRLPVFMTATCELARFDDPEFYSAGEAIVMNPNGGAIAMLTTTRIVFSASNQQLARAFFDIALENENIDDLTLGLIAKTTKNDSQVSAGSNKRNFSLLGDPALKMSYPKYEVFTSTINGTEISLNQDTIRSLQEVTVKGYVGTIGGQKLNEFNGFVYPTVYDKQLNIQTLNNDGGVDYDFEMFKNIIYKGKASVVNGDFEFSFVVPFDINYSYGPGRISYYAVSGDDDGNGHTESFTIGGALEGAQLDGNGPKIELYMNDSSFVFGGVTNENPLIFAKLFDENGINTVGNGIGHDLKAILNGETNDPIVLNDYYESDLDTYKSGEVRYQLAQLPQGKHTLTLKVWDVHNNSSESATEFVVAESAEMALKHVLNYPNPFTTSTEFFFEHNQACESLDVQIQIFTISGKVVKTIHRNVRTPGFRSEGIHWDGRDDFGDKIGKGVYVYRVKAVTPDGSKAEQFEKLVILN